MDLLLDSNVLKSHIIQRINEEDYDYRLLAAKTGVDQGKLNHYLMNYEMYDKYLLSHDDLFKICELLDIKILMKVTSLTHRHLKTLNK